MVVGGVVVGHVNTNLRSAAHSCVGRFRYHVYMNRNRWAGGLTRHWSSGVRGSVVSWNHGSTCATGRKRTVTSSVAIDFGSFGSSPLVPPDPALPIVISGPSGVGKDAVIRRLQEKRPDLYFVVTATSRAMRPGEKDGVDYFFVTKDTFECWIEEGRLLEHAVVYGEYKGIPREQVEEALGNKTDVILRVDVQGAATMRKLLPDMVSIFLVAETEQELVQRLVDRKTEPPVRFHCFTFLAMPLFVSQEYCLCVGKDEDSSRDCERRDFSPWRV